jgi:lysozyme
MAEDISGNARELADAMAEVQRELARYGKVSAETADRLVDAQMKAKYGIENFSKGVGKATDAVGSLAAAGIEAGKAMYEGKKGAAAFNSSLDQLSAAATAAGTALALLIPGGFIVKGLVAGLTMATTAAIAYTKAANDMADKLYTGYSKLQESGAAAADGMTGVFNDAKKLGLSMNQLDSMIGLVANNSQELALMSGSVAEGRKKFAEVGEALESSRASFFKMGISQEAQNEGLMRYTRNMTLAGRAQNMTTKELEAGAKAYIYEQDKLTKLTGMSAQKQQALLDRARENEQFNAKLRMLELKGDAESLAAAERLKQGLQVAAMAGDESAEAFMASVNGNLRNQAAQKANLSTFGEMGRYARDLEAGTTTATKGFEKVARAGADYERGIGVQRSALEAGAETQFKTSTMQRLALIDQMGIDEARKKIEADQLKQQEGQGDAITNEYGKMLKTQQEINAKLEKDVFKGIPNALANMNRLADVTDKLADAFSSLTTGLNKLLNLVGLGVKEDKVAGKQKEIEETQKALAKAQTDQVNAKTEIEKINAARDTKFYAEKLEALREEKDVVSKKEEVAKMEADIIKRAEEQRKIARAKSDAALATGTAAQKAGFGRDDAQKKAVEEYLAADKRVRELQAFGGALAKKEARQAGAGAGSSGPDASDNRFARQGTPAGATDGQGATRTGSNNMQPPKKTASSGRGGNMSEEDIKQMIIAHEGKRYEPYKDSMGLWTVGIGHLIGDGKTLPPEWNRKFSEEEIMKLFDEDYRHHRLAAQRIPGFDKIGTSGQGALTDLTFNMGPSWIEKWPILKGQLASLDLEGAASNLERSQWYAQVKSRGPTIVDLVRNSSVTAEEGGVYSGPDTGYAATLHGDEAVVPLNNAGGNFVKVFEDMAMMMGKQVGAIDELIRVAKNGNDIQTKILRIQS